VKLYDRDLPGCGYRGRGTWRAAFTPALLTVGAAVQSSVEDKEAARQLACVNCYFMCQDGSTFKAQVKYQPYMYIGVKVFFVPSAPPESELVWLCSPCALAGDGPTCS
jgi:hypothetical protein